MLVRYTLFFFVVLLCPFIIEAQIPNEFCTTATPISLGLTCIEGSNKGASTDNQSCIDATVQDVWYQYTATFNGLLHLVVNARYNDTLFNDVLSIYTGNCTSLSEVKCSNDDEYGFEGEQEYFSVTSGQTYYFSISGQAGNFGLFEGDFCLSVNQGSMPSAPANDDPCDHDLFLVDEWESGDNYFAAQSSFFPDRLKRSRADVWYAFVPTIGEEVSIEVRSTFSTRLAVYEGECTNMSLLAKSISGSSKLLLNDLTVGQTYFFQISGRFATLEGEYYVQFKDKMPSEINENDLCEEAIPLETGTACIEYDMSTFSFSGQRPTCVFYPGSDIWFKYTAPLEFSGGLKLNTGADFLHTIAVYEGECDSLMQIMCSSSNVACEEYLLIPNVLAGNTYYIQIIIDNRYFNQQEGAGCIQIINGIQSENILPLELEVTPFCLSSSTARLYVDVNHGSGNYTFHGNTDGDELTIGDSYFVQVVDANGCMQAASGIVDCSTPYDCDLFYYLETKDVSCNGDVPDGTASIVLSGDPNTTLNWSTGSTSASVSGLSAGNYSLTVTNSLGCSFVLPVAIEEPLPLDVSSLAQPTSSEIAEDGSILILPSGGVPPYSYLWEEGGTSQRLSGLLPISYNFTVTDVNNCVVDGSATVSIDSLCPSNEYITTSVGSSNSQLVKTSDWIVSSSEIKNQGQAEYKAGTLIVLQDGFAATLGSSFSATIEECTVTENSICELAIGAISETIISGNVVKLDWADVPKVKKYRVRYRVAGQAWSEVQTDVSYRFLNNLQASKLYEYQIKVVCDNDASAWSATHTFISGFTLCDYPEGTTNISNLTSNSASISWLTKPSDQKYKIRWKAKGSDWVVETVNNNVYNLNNLASGTIHFYKIKTKCPNGWTQWTSKGEFITPSFRQTNSTLLKASISTYPNPTTDWLTIDWNYSTDVTAEIRTIDGKTLQLINLSVGKNEIDLRSLPNGVYFIHVSTAEEQFIRKVVKQ